MIRSESSAAIQRIVGKTSLNLVSTHLDDLKSWRGMHSALNSSVSDVEDDEGYRTLPWFGVLYQGASAWANNTYFSLVPAMVAEGPRRLTV